MNGLDLVGRMGARLQELLEERTNELPVPFTVVGSYETDRFMSILAYRVRPVKSIEGVHDCSRVFEAIRSQLEGEFRSEPIGAAICLDVPGQFRGPQAALTKVEQGREIEKHKSIRLEGRSNG